MKRHSLLFPFLMFAGTGCSGMQSLLAFDERAPQTAAVAPAAVEPAPAVEAPEAFCRRVAASARSQSDASGFDISTQERIAAQNYQQCMALGRAG